MLYVGIIIAVTLCAGMTTFWTAFIIDTLLEDWGVNFPSIWSLPPVEEEAFDVVLGIDSWSALEASLNAEGLLVSGMSCRPSTGQPVAFIADPQTWLEDRPTQIDSSNSGLDPSYAPPFFILNIDDEYVERCNRRDGLCEDTIVEMACEGTLVLDVDEDEEFLSLIPPTAWIDCGSDEATFFFPTSFDDTFWTEQEFELAPTMVN
jgi:hypothetical protein